MSNTSTIQNSLNPLPLTNERKNIAPVLDTPENFERIDRAGFFDENPVEFDKNPTEGIFNANSGDQIIFNPLKTEVPQAYQKAFEDESPSRLNPVMSELFKDGVSVTFGAVQKGISAVGDILKDSGDAFLDLGKTIVGTDVPQAYQKSFEGEDLSKLDPSEAAKKQEEAQKQAEYLEKRQQEEGIEAQISSVRQKIAVLEQQQPIRQEVSKLTGIPEWAPDLVGLDGEIRIDLQPQVEQKKRQQRQAMIEGQNSTIAPPVHHGAEGPGMSMRAVDDGEKHGSTSGTAVG